MRQDPDDAFGTGDPGDCPEGDEPDTPETPPPIPCRADTIPGSEWTKEEIDEIFTLYFKAIDAYCHRRFSKNEDAEDATHRVFEQLLQYHSYDPAKAEGGGVRGYLYAIAWQVCNAMLNALYPFVLYSQCPRKLKLIADEPFAFDFLVSPPDSDCTLADVPGWLTLCKKKRNRVTSTWRVEGTAPQTGKWIIEVAVSDWKKDFSMNIEMLILSKPEFASLPAEPPVDLSKLKKEGLRARHEDVENADESIEISAPSFGRRDLVKRLLTVLSEDERRVVEMRFLEGKSIKEIAEITGKTPNTVSQTISRALRKMHRFLDDEDGRAEGRGPIR